MGKPLIKADSLTSNLGQKSYSPLPEAYKARRTKLIELEKEFKKLFKKRLNGTITKSELSRFGSLPREIKAVTITDPTVIFKKKPNGKWDYIKENRWKVKGEPLAPGLKPIESHHKGGLDKYYGKIKGWDDDDIYQLHNSLAKRNRYLGNHPKNRLQLDSSTHQGRARQNVVWDESIHGRIDAKDLSPAEFDQYIDDLIIENITDNDALPKQSLIPDDADFLNATSDDIDRIGDMLDSDYDLADEFTNKPVNKNLLWEGKTKSSRVTNFIKNNKANEAFWPEDTLEALKNQDLDRIVEIEKQLPGLREAAMQDALKSGKTLQQWQDVSRGSRALFASPVTKVAAVGIGFGLWDAFTGTQDAISGTHDYLNPKEGISDLERTADGLKAFSGALTAASPLVGATAIPAIGAKLGELHLRRRALKAKTRYDTIHDRTSTPTDLEIRKTNEWDQVQYGTL